MTEMKRSSFALLLGFAACASNPSPPAPAPASSVPPAVEAANEAVDLTDHLGDSPGTAVQVPADAPNEGVDFDNNWIYDRFGRFRRVKWGLAHDDQRRYDVITVELSDASLHTVYFDITEMWKNWKPK